MRGQQFTYTVRTIIERLSDGSGEVLMVHNLVRGEKTAGWGLPGGGLDPNDESLEIAAARETWEETGLKISPKDLVERGRTLARESDSHFNCLFRGPSYNPSMGELTIENDPGKTVDDVAWIPYEDIMYAYLSYKNGGPPVDSFGNRYYPSHLREICGDGQS